MPAADTLVAERPGSYMNLSGPVVLAVLASAALGLATANPLLTVAAILAIPALIVLLWRVNEPPIILIAVLFQWLQVMAKVFQANLEGVPVVAIAESESVETAIWMSLLGLIVLAVGMRLGMHWLRPVCSERIRQEVSAFSVRRAFLLYLVLTAVTFVVGRAAWAIPPLTQPLLAVAAVKWVGFFLLAYLVLSKRRGMSLLVLATAIEFIDGVGFFANFDMVLFVILIVALSFHERLDAPSVGRAAAVVGVMIIIGAVWSNVKDEYRTHLTHGERTQQVHVDRWEQITTLGELVSEQRPQDVAGGVEALFNRLAYVDFFGFVLEYVPEVRPHEAGEIWLASVRHTAMPRLLYPDKPEVMSASDLTMAYTGLQLASIDEGTSISIGYMGESYIDFGGVGMYVAMLLLGLLLGLMYAFLLNHARIVLIGFAAAVVVLMGAYQFEITSIGLLGGVMTRFLLFAVLLRAMEAPIVGWLRSGPAEEAVPAPETVAGRAAGV